MKIFTKFMMLVIAFGVLVLPNLQAQTDSNAVMLDESDPEEFRYSFDYKSFFAGDFETVIKNHNSINGYNTNPIVSAKYSLINPAIHSDKFGGKFSEAANISLQAGYSYKEKETNSSVIKYDCLFAQYDNYSSKLGIDREKDKVGTEAWKIGVGTTTGFGWQITPSFDINLYNGENMNWYSMQFDLPGDNNLSDKDKAHLKAFADGTRFGRTFTGGVEFKVCNSLGINFGYEQEQIFMRHKFMKWFGSEIIENMASEVVISFCDEIVDRSKIGGPIMNFIVRNAVSYGVYELRKKKASWPFDTEAPIYIDKFQLGISYTF